MRTLLPLLLCSGPAALVGCGEGDDTGVIAEPEPDLQVSVTEIVLTEIPWSGWGQQTAAVELANHGKADLFIDSVAVVDGTAWELEFDYGALWLLPGDVQWVTLRFSPETVGVWEDTLRVLSNDPDSPQVDISLSGEAVAGVLTADVEALDFGEAVVTCTSTAPLTFTNTGYDDLYVEQISLSGAPSTVSLDLGEVEFPVLLATGESISLSASFTPDGWKDLAGKIVAKTTGGGESSTEVPLAGEVITGETHEAEATIPHYDVVDVLLALDRSSSMRTLASALQYETDTLLEVLAAPGYDLHLAWTVEDTGCINGEVPWLDQASSLEEADAVGVEMVDLYGLSHSVSDQAFTMLYAALEASASGGCSEGLLRSEASWHLVGISDDPEMSGDPWVEFWSERFLAQQAEGESLAVHGLGNDEAETCARLEPYDGVLEAVAATDGSFHLLCEDAATVMADLGAAIVERQDAVGEASRTLALGVQADGGAMTVSLDGSETSDWSYDADANVVVLDEQPPGGVVYGVTYSALMDCP